MSKLVSFFVNCFERDYRQVLAPGFMAAKAAQFKYPFTRRVVTVNNVNDRGEARRLAQAAVDRCEIDAYLEVDKELSHALGVCGLSMRQLGLIRHYIDFALVAVNAACPGYLLYCCAEVEQDACFDWVTPALAKMEQDPRYLVANPSWASDPEGACRESIGREGPHWVGRGFSDQCFLVDARRLARPVYGYTHPDGARYPMSDLGDIFEKRIDAFMRKEGLLRITDSRVSYTHHGIEGLNYPKAPVWLRFRRKLKGVLQSDAMHAAFSRRAPKEGGAH